MEDQINGEEDDQLEAKDERESRSIWVQAGFVEKIPKRNKVKRR